MCDLWSLYFLVCIQLVFWQIFFFWTRERERKEKKREEEEEGESEEKILHFLKFGSALGYFHQHLAPLQFCLTLHFLLALILEATRGSSQVFSEHVSSPSYEHDCLNFSICWSLFPRFFSQAVITQSCWLNSCSGSFDFPFFLPKWVLRQAKQRQAPQFTQLPDRLEQTDKHIPC